MIFIEFIARMESTHRFRCLDIQSNLIGIFVGAAVEQIARLNNGIFHENVWHITLVRSMKLVVRVVLVELIGHFHYLQLAVVRSPHAIHSVCRCYKINYTQTTIKSISIFKKKN